MSSEFRVDLEQLDQIASRLNGLSSFVTSHLDELDNKIGSLRHGSWESLAASAYAEAHAQWSSAAREFARGVAEVSHAARRAHERYTRAVELSRQMHGGG
ncbi:WXG100 family type VII secretion target [Nocardia sp. NPDC003482]